jgi:hypothetical protein
MGKGFSHFMDKTFEFPIFPPYEAFYIASMLYLTGSALASENSFAEFLEKNAENIHETDPEPPLNHLQNIIIQGAALSRYFWPTRSGYENRAKKLRDSLSIKDASPLKSRDLRNQMEHFDEHLDDYLKTTIAGQVVPHYIGVNPGNNDGVPLHLFRAYFINTGIFEILGKRYAIPPIMEEIGRIHNLLLDCEKNGSRLPAIGV